MRPVFYLLLLLSFAPIQSFCQSSDLNQFYSSDYAPPELNEQTEDRIKELYRAYLRDLDEKSVIDEKEFVYDHNYFLDRLNRSGNIFFGDSIGAYLTDLKDIILEDNPLKKKVNVYVSNFPVFNAFTNDFGNIYVNIAAIAKVEREEELMFLLAHEIGHIIMHHSHAQVVAEKLNQAVLKDGENSDFERHKFSQSQELQADSIALALLKDKVPLSFSLDLMNHLSQSSNPVYRGKMDFNLLGGGHELVEKILDSLWHASLEEKVFFEIEESNAPSTHPTIEDRIAYLTELDSSKSNDYHYTATGRFDELNELSKKVLLQTYLEDGMNLEALDLCLKMRNKSSSNMDLIHSQIKALTCLIRDKHHEQNGILNSNGNSLTDKDFLRFKKMYLEMSPTDFNIIAILSIERLSQQLSDKIKVLPEKEKAFQFLYASEPKYFTYDPELEHWAYDTTYQDSQVLDSLEVDVDANDKLSKKEKKEQRKKKKWIDEESRSKLTELGYVFIDPNNKSLLRSRFIKAHPIREEHVSFLENFKVQDSLVSYSVPSAELEEVFMSPPYSVFYFKRGKFFHSPKFDPQATVALAKTYNMYFKSWNKRRFKLDIPKTLELTKTIKSIEGRYQSYTHNLSNEAYEHSSKSITVFDNNLHRTIDKWRIHLDSDEAVNYSPLEQNIRSHFDSNDIEYLVYRICVVNRNRGVGKKFYLNFYEIYYDIEHEGVAYLSKIASTQKLDKFQLEQMIYLSENNKMSNSK